MKFIALISAAALALAVPTKRADSIMYPAATYRRWIQTGQMVLDPQDQLLVVKNGNPADETSTLVTFDFPAESAGKTCELIFELWDRDISTGTQTLDVFTYTDPPATAVELVTVAAFKGRDHHAGRIQVPKPGNATWVMSYDGWPTIPCPAGEVLGIEYVGAGDAVEVRWDIGVTGPRFRVIG
jgi:hypothetical protein